MRQETGGGHALTALLLAEEDTFCCRGWHLLTIAPIYVHRSLCSDPTWPFQDAIFCVYFGSDLEIEMIHIKDYVHLENTLMGLHRNFSFML